MLVNFLLLSTVLFLFSGLALDVGILQLRKLELQHAADAAALGAIYEKKRGYSDWIAAGKADAALNGFTDGVNGVTISVVSPPTSGSYSGDVNAAQTTVRLTYHSSFMGIVSGSSNATPGVTSVAAVTPNPDCTYVMGTGSGYSGWSGWQGGGTTFGGGQSGGGQSGGGQSGGGQSGGGQSGGGQSGGGQSGGGQCGNGWNGWISGNGYSYYPLGLEQSASISSACNVYVDSSNYSLGVDSNSAVSVTGGKCVKTQAASSGASLQGSVWPAPASNAPSENDPLAYETAPTFSSCTYYNVSLSHTTVTLNPGTYCGGITTNQSTVTFNPGLYIVTGGMNWTSNSTIKGTGVTFYLTSGGGSSYGDFNISNSTVTLSAPTSTSGGGSTGILVFADRNWSDPGNQDVEISSSNLTTDGIWYVLNTGIECDSSTWSAINYLGIVTDNLQLNDSALTIPSPNYSSLSGGSPYQGSSGCSLVQ